MQWGKAQSNVVQPSSETHFVLEVNLLLFSKGRGDHACIKYKHSLGALELLTATTISLSQSSDHNGTDCEVGQLDQLYS
jgi:hypothetical protein